MNDEREICMDYPPLDADGNVTNGSVDSYDFDWGEGVVRREEQLPPKDGEWPYLCCFDWPDCWPYSDPCPDLCPNPSPEPCPNPCPAPCEWPCDDHNGCGRTAVSKQDDGDEDYEIRDI